MVLNKRIFRGFRQGFVRYAALFLVVVLAVAVIVGMAASTDSIQGTVAAYQAEQNCEDGSFSVYAPLAGAQLREIEALGYRTQAQFYIDLPVEGGELRVLSPRKEINLPLLLEGSMPDGADRLALEQRYAQAAGYAVGDTLSVNGKTCTITGVFCAPDYVHPMQNLTDLGADHAAFGLALATEDGFSELQQTGGRTVYQYAYRLTEDTPDGAALRDYLLKAPCDEDAVTDTYLRDKYEENRTFREELEADLTALEDGSADLRDGVAELGDGLSRLRQQATRMGLGQVAAQLRQIETAALQEGAETLRGNLATLKEELLDLVDEQLTFEPVNLASFLERDGNKRLNAAQDDAAINKMAALYSGIIVFLLIAFLFSVFAVHSVEAEREIVGTLYAVGYRRRELVRHFITLPVLVALIGSVCGLALGYVLVFLFAQGNVALYSYPALRLARPLYLTAYGLLMPNVMTFLINQIVLRRKLNEAPLKLLRGERKEGKVSKVDLGNLSYLNRYRIRQTLRELRTTVILFVGLGIAILLMVWGFAIYGGISEYTEKIKADVPHEYLYLLSNPLEDAPKEGEQAYLLSYQTAFDLTGGNMEVTLMGVSEDSAYYSFGETLPKNSREAAISDAAAMKFGYGVGDQVVLWNNLTEQCCRLTITDVVPYKSGLSFFMNLDAMRELQNAEDDYYNALLSDTALDVDPVMQLSCITREGMADVGALLLQSMMSMILGMIGISIVLFVLVMYLLMKMMIDRASFSISLLKMFGYRDGEVKKLYLRSSFFLVLLAAVVHIPLSKCIVNLIFPNTVSDVTAYMGAHLTPLMYGLIFVLILVSYGIVYGLLYHRLKRISFAAVLKQRD